MTSSRLVAALAALALGAGVGVGCSDRENVERSNDGVQTSEGGKSEVETGPTTLQSTGETQPEVTQPEDGG